MKFELNSAAKAQGMQLRAAVSANAIQRMDGWNKEMGKIISRMIRFGLAKEAATMLSLAKEARWHEQLRDISSRHDKIIYDRNGKSVAMYDYRDDKFYDYDPEG